jgi:hypothetical protein
MAAVDGLKGLDEANRGVCRESQPHFHVTAVRQLRSISANSLLKSGSNNRGWGWHDIPRPTVHDKLWPVENTLIAWARDGISERSVALFIYINRISKGKAHFSTTLHQRHCTLQSSAQQVVIR